MSINALKLFMNSIATGQNNPAQTFGKFYDMAQKRKHQMVADELARRVAAMNERKATVDERKIGLAEHQAEPSYIQQTTGIKEGEKQKTNAIKDAGYDAVGAFTDPVVKTGPSPATRLHDLPGMSFPGFGVDTGANASSQANVIREPLPGPTTERPPTMGESRARLQMARVVKGNIDNNIKTAGAVKKENALRQPVIDTAVQKADALAQPNAQAASLKELALQGPRVDTARQKAQAVEQTNVDQALKIAEGKDKLKHPALDPLPPIDFEGMDKGAPIIEQHIAQFPPAEQKQMRIELDRVNAVKHLRDVGLSVFDRYLDNLSRGAQETGLFPTSGMPGSDAMNERRQLNAEFNTHIRALEKGNGRIPVASLKYFQQLAPGAGGTIGHLPSWAGGMELPLAGSSGWPGDSKKDVLRKRDAFLRQVNSLLTAPTLDGRILNGLPGLESPPELQYSPPAE